MGPSIKMSGRSHQGSDNNEKQQNHTVLVINPHCAGNKKLEYVPKSTTNGIVDQNKSSHSYGNLQQYKNNDKTAAKVIRRHCPGRTKN